ncbi:HAMP domain-containing histidine kinase [bacterium]|nr:HAMP domain-containing histidine kinase [bacterium]
MIEKKIDEKNYLINKINSNNILSQGIVHDLNNVLTMLQGNLTLAKMEINRSDKAIEILNNAQQVCERSKGLIRQLSVLYDDNSNKKVKLSVSEIIRYTAKFCVMSTKIYCEFSLPKNLWFINANEGQINQVFTNLILNSIQAMPKSGVIKIKAKNTIVDNNNDIPLNGNFVKVTVKDNGYGISEDILPKIFDPYYTTKKNGKGLGLSIVNFIIQKHNGYISVDSKVGEGTSFDVYLPAII